MRWADVRRAFPDQWLVIEALQAQSMAGWRLLDEIVVMEVCQDGAAAFHAYRSLHRQRPGRELYYVHTGRQELQIKERYWPGIRRTDRSGAARN